VLVVVMVVVVAFDIDDAFVTRDDVATVVCDR
jgi:hypothetical protein